MSVTLVENVWFAWRVYLGIGAAFALAFVLFGVQRVDPAARGGATWGFRILIVPGSIILWPWLASRWIRSSPSPPEESNAHRARAHARGATTTTERGANRPGGAA